MIRAITVSCLVLVGTVVAGQPPGDDVALKIVKYDGLKDIILKNRGKVVFVDFWADF